MICEQKVTLLASDSQCCARWIPFESGETGTSIGNYTAPRVRFFFQRCCKPIKTCRSIFSLKREVVVSKIIGIEQEVLAWIVRNGNSRTWLRRFCVFGNKPEFDNEFFAATTVNTNNSLWIDPAVVREIILCSYC